MPRLVKTISVAKTVAEAKSLMKRSGLEGLAVFDNSRMSGIVTAQAAARARHPNKITSDWY